MQSKTLPMLFPVNKKKEKRKLMLRKPSDHKIKIHSSRHRHVKWSTIKLIHKESTLVHGWRLTHCLKLLKELAWDHTSKIIIHKNNNNVYVMQYVRQYFPPNIKIFVPMWKLTWLFKGRVRTVASSLLRSLSGYVFLKIWKTTCHTQSEKQMPNLVTKMKSVKRLKTTF